MTNPPLENEAEDFISRPRPNQSENREFKAPTFTAPAMRQSASLGHLVPAWTPEDAGFLGLTARTSHFALSDPYQAGGLTPSAFVAGYKAQGREREVTPVEALSGPAGQLYGYAKEWLSGWSEEPTMFQYRTDPRFIEQGGAEAYLNLLYKRNPESWDLYTEEHRKAILNSESADEIHAKLMYFGNEQAALNSLEYYDNYSGPGLGTAVGKTLSAANMLLQDPATWVTFGTAGATLKGINAMSKGSKTLRTVLSAGAGGAEGAAYGWLYENNRVNGQRALGNQDAVFDNTTVGWGMGLGFAGGMLGGVLYRNVKDDKLVAALSDELSGGPTSKLRTDGVVGMDEASELATKETTRGTRQLRALQSVGADAKHGGWINNPRGFKYTPFATADEAIDWIETAKPTKQELQAIDDFIADAMIRDKNNGIVNLRMKMQKTEFQKTGKAPKKTPVENNLSGLELIGATQQQATNVGFLQSLPGSKAAGRILGTLGTWGVRGGGYRRQVKDAGEAIGVVQNLYHSIAKVGVRDGDVMIARGAAPSLDAANRVSQKNFAPVIQVINENSDFLQMKAREGVDIVSVIQRGGDDLGDVGKELHKALKESLDVQGRTAQAAGLIESKDDYFPILFNKGKALDNEEQFVEALTQYLVKEFTGKGADINLIHAKALGWISGETAGSVRVTKAGLAAGLKQVQKRVKGVKSQPIRFDYDSLNDDARKLYDEGLEESLNTQAIRTSQVMQGNNLESLLRNPLAVDEGAMRKQGFFTNSTYRQSFDKNIYQDPGMAPFMNQDIQELMIHANRMGSEAEFALGQASLFGESVTMGQLIGKTRKYVESKTNGTVSKDLTEMIDKVEQIYLTAMGMAPKGKSEFAQSWITGAVEAGSNAARAMSGLLWGIPVASMEVPRQLFVQGDQAGIGMRDFINACKSGKERWRAAASLGDAMEFLNLNLRGTLENSAHEGQFLGYTWKQRLAAPWIRVGAEAQAAEGMVEKFFKGGNATVAAFANTVTQAGLMPLLTAAGRISVGRFAERSIISRLPNLKKLSEALEGKNLGSVADGANEGGKIFKGLAREAGFGGGKRYIDEAIRMNRAGLLDPDVIKFMEKAKEAGVLDAKDFDFLAMRKWVIDKSNAARKGLKRKNLTPEETAKFHADLALEDEVRKFNGAMTEYVTERMNYTYATPNAMSRIDINDNDPMRQAASLFMSFPAAFYQQNLTMVAGDASSKGSALFLLYMGGELAHRAIRDVADPVRALTSSSSNFGDPKAVIDGWMEKPGETAYNALTGSLPLTGLFPVGKFFGQSLFGRPNQGNIVEGKFNQLGRLINKQIPDGGDPGPDIALRYADLFNSRQ